MGNVFYQQSFINDLRIFYYQANRVYGDELPLAHEFITDVKRKHEFKLLQIVCRRAIERDISTMFIKSCKDEQLNYPLLFDTNSGGINATRN